MKRIILEQGPARVIVVLLMACVLIMAGCGGDDPGAAEDTAPADDPAPTDDAAPAEEETESAEDDAAAEPAGDAVSEELCDAALAMETAPEPEIDWESATPEEMQEAMSAWAEEELLPRAQAIQAVAPEEISETVDRLVEGVEQTAETGDTAMFEDPEFLELQTEWSSYAGDECGWARQEVTATDYSFGDAPDEMAAGVTLFELANEGEEFHEIILARRNDGVTESFEELLEMEEQEAMEHVEVKFLAFAPPGEQATGVYDLTAGDYAFLCFIPVGTTDMESEAEGPPHFAHGMVHEFTVTDG